MQRPAQLIGTLAVALGATALLLALPAWLRFGAMGLEGLLYAALASFVPGVLLALAASWFTGPQKILQLVLASTALRVGFVLLVGLAVVQSRPALKSTEFFLGLGVFYLIALAVETRQLLAELTSSSSRQPQSN